MSEEKLYAVKDDEGKYWDFEDQDGFWELNTVGLAAIADEEGAKCVAHDHGGHVVAFVEEPEKVVLSKKQAKIVEKARDATYPADYISGNSGLGASGEEELLMEAFVNGYTGKSDKKYLVYKELGGKQKHEQFAQAYRSSDYPGTVRWILTNEVINRSFAQFAESEIEHYGLQNCECVEAKE